MPVFSLVPLRIVIFIVALTNYALTNYAPKITYCQQQTYKEVSKMRNDDIRRAAAANRVHLWRIAEAYGMTDSNFSKLLRHELPPEKKQKILSIINEIASQKD